jgi:hypothetical protein
MKISFNFFIYKKPVDLIKIQKTFIYEKNFTSNNNVIGDIICNQKR